MKKTHLFLLTWALSVIFTGSTLAQKQNFPSRPPDGKNVMIDTRIDCMKYWGRLAELGLVPVAPEVQVPAAKYTGSQIIADGVKSKDSQDVPVTTENNTTQSENSIFVNPNDPEHVLNSNNSTDWNGGSVGTLYGTSHYTSEDAGVTFEGSHLGPGGSNSGDPTTAIGLDGKLYINFITNSYGQGIAVSSDNGATWNNYNIATGPGGWGVLDKNHLWIDNSSTSPYQGNLYAAWTNFGGSNDSEIEFSRSTNGGVTWSNPVNISTAINAGSHNQGVNIQTGPNGEVYVTWTIYDSWPSDENSMGFCKSTDGGVTFTTASRIITNIRGVRTSGTSKNQRVASFPSTTVDRSGGTFNGNIYIVWPNIGVPGINTGSDIDIYMIYSSNGGVAWSAPIRVNQDPSNLGNEHYYPWITCDPGSGTLSCVFYDDRNVGGNQCEVFCANSFDGGITWEDFKVSDVSFTPNPIPGLASSYMGDYLGITALDSYVYPCWTDTRDNKYMSYVSPYVTNNLPKPVNLLANVNQANGQVDMTWEFTTVPGFQYFKVYRDDVFLGNTTNLNYLDNLPTYGVYVYKVTAFHDAGESVPAIDGVQWGDAQIEIEPAAISHQVNVGMMAFDTIHISNTGQLPLIYNIDVNVINKKNGKDYCAASGGCDEFISNVTVGTINNSSSCDNYYDYTSLSTDMQSGDSYVITITNGTPMYSGDQCGVWVDWNQDEDWDDAGESIPVNGSPGVGPYTATITVPSDAVPGTTRLRTRIIWTDPLSPCGTTSYGEVEDYSVNISNWLLVNPLGGDTVQPGESREMYVTLDGTIMPEGTYNANINVLSNDPDNSTVTIPVTFVISVIALNTNPYADPQAICSGDQTQLFANAIGGTNVFTYSWTSDPAGFTSNEANPVVNPSVNTTYLVEVNDGQSTVNGQTTVTVMDVPDAPAAPDGPESLCINPDNSTYTTAGSAGAISYAWDLSPTTAGTISGDGLTGIVNWDPLFTGDASVMVKSVNECGESAFSASLITAVHPLPEVSLTVPDSVCVYAQALQLTGGSPAGGTYTGTGVSNGYFNPVVAGTGNHIITYTFQDAFGCENFTEQTINVDECFGINENIDNLNVVIYPNPNSGNFTIKINTASVEILQVKLVNSLGVEIFKSSDVKVTGSWAMTLDLQEYGEGIYFLTLFNNDMNYVGKIVVK